jgi:RNA polymerase sigma-70 factor (ECF subfamily)
MTDWSPSIERLRALDNGEWLRVQDTYCGRLLAYANRRTGDLQASEDVVQEIFANVWRRAASVNYDDPLPYLYQAARNRALSVLRSRRVRERWQAAQTEAGAAAAAVAEPSPDTTALASAIEQAIDALPERCRLIFRMHREQQLTYREIARLLGISAKTVDHQMGRALKALRERLAPYLPAGVVLLALTDSSLRLLS